MLVFGGKTPEDSFTTNPSALLHLRASDWVRCERPKPQDAVVIQSECPYTLKGIGLDALPNVPMIGTPFTTNRMPFDYLRASDSTAFDHPKPRGAVDVQSEQPRALKGVGLGWLGGRQRRRIKASVLAISGRPEPQDLVRILSNGRVTLKGVEPNRLRGAMTCHPRRPVRRRDDRLGSSLSNVARVENEPVILRVAHGVTVGVARAGRRRENASIVPSHRACVRTRELNTR